MVRLHPTDPWDRYAKFHEPGRVFVERTGREDLRSMAEWYPSADEERRYSALLEHADCLVNIGSTASLDAAARGTPVVFVGFDPEAGLPYHRSVRRQFDYDHLRRLMSYRVGRLVTSVDDMMDAVQSTFVSQDDRRATLRNMAASEGFDESGGSAERVAETVARLAHA